MVASQQLLIVSSEPTVAPSDDFLWKHAFSLLKAKSPSTWRAVRDGAVKGLFGTNLPGATANLAQLASANYQSFPKDPESRGIALVYARPLVLELLRAIYACDLKAVLPEALVTQPLDPKLSKFSCTDGSFICKTTYVRHPTDPNFFIRLADFHSYLLQEKRAEFFRLAAFLGAKEVRLIDSREHSRNAYMSMSIAEPTGAIDSGAKGSTSRQTRNSFDLSASFTVAGAKPSIPDQLRWFEVEPLWKAMAEARVCHWVEKFRVSFVYSQDFDVNASLVAKVADLGFSAGGTFAEIQRVEQEYVVEFFPRSDYNI